MKRSDTDDFCVLYLEVADNRATLSQALSELRKPVVIMLAEQGRLFQRPDDFSALKHIKRQLDIPVIFVIPNSGHITQLATRFGFPVYSSVDNLANALAMGQLSRQRTHTAQTSPQRITAPLSPTASLHTLKADLRNAGPRGPISQPLHTASESEPVMELSAGGQPLDAREHTTGHMPPVSQMDVPPRVEKRPVASPQPSLPRERLRHNPALERFDPYTQALQDEESEPEPLILERNAPPMRRSGVAQRASTGMLVEKTQSPPREEPLAPAPRAPRNTFAKFVAIVAIIALSVAGLSYFLVFYHQWPTTTTTSAVPPIVGDVSYASSNQISEKSSQGISDQITIDLQQLNPPASGKAYYAWLLGDKSQSEAHTILMGRLNVSNGKAHLFYSGDPQHSNLLLTTSRFLVTEESASVTPISPTPDYNAWRYYGEVSQAPINTPDNTNHFSYLDHLRHLLASDPTLEKLNLPGGLNTWFYRNTAKLVEWTTSMRDPWEANKDINYVRRMTARTLAYLDGASFVGLDLPPGTPALVDGRLAQIGLIQVNGPDQEPPCYLSHVMKHLNGLLQAPDAPASLRQNATDIVNALSDVNRWLNQVRSDGKKIMQMNDDQLRQPSTLSLINDMVVNANNAYIGQTDANTGQTLHGANWIHDHMQSISTFQVSPYRPSPQSIQMIQDILHAKA
ncbi:hypothetical protein KSD_91560 [Ktedonobacter sp. SOSP1-85]|uniref:hypothetical protein n=1 Tax=Ktedonobacter sp. SOSP1-85 TaxID=2778367 RepID=UPI0019163E5F|nr:hypothetical protein [Ktedonobacter sp. SOSP1-85]GHO81385.1 hypothetical protein KSD_91560 [Ktedonobacter sp. SOSP1-85]